MNGPADSLRRDLAQLDEALEPFSAPLADERAGLRWMQRTLHERRAQILDKIAATEDSTVALRLRTARGTAAVGVDSATALLDAIQRSVTAAADDLAWPAGLDASQRRAAVRLEVGAADRSDGWWTITLHRPAGPLAAQPRLDDGRLAFDAAVDALLDRLDDESCEIAQVATAEQVLLELRTSLVTVDDRLAVVDRSAAARVE